MTLKKTISSLVLLVISMTPLMASNIHVAKSISSSFKIQLSKSRGNVLLPQAGSSLRMSASISPVKWLIFGGGVSFHSYKPSQSVNGLNYRSFSGVTADVRLAFIMNKISALDAEIKLESSFWGSFSVSQYSSTSLLFFYPGIGLSPGITINFNNTPFLFGFYIPFELYLRRDLVTAISTGATLSCILKF
jgi:hypothetical protein